jgi:dihydropteroate synthase
MARARYLLRARDKTLELGLRTRLMAVVNVTPDSFSDGGRFLSPERAVEHGLRLVEAGADILDIGAESTRPGAIPVSEEEELERILPVLEGLRRETAIPVSVDTYKARIAEEALRLGADIVNDISALRFDARMATVAAEFRAGVVLMQMRGTPASMHRLSPSRDILSEVRRDLQVAVDKATSAGIARDRMLLDPGIGFGKNAAENLVLLNRLTELAGLNLPILVGPSRKSFIGGILGRPVQDRLLGTAAASAVCILRGSHLLRVHDVGEIGQVARVVDAILAEQIET